MCSRAGRWLRGIAFAQITLSALLLAALVAPLRGQEGEGQNQDQTEDPGQPPTQSPIQDQIQPQGQSQQPGSVSTRLTTVRGMVRTGASEPLPHALVRINGDAATGVLTDGDGRFEIANVPEGPLDFTVTKPGFLDKAEAVADSIAWNAHGYGHNVIVAPGMGDVVFTMEPVNSIHGQILLSTGEVAEGIQVNLLKRIIQDGRAVWQTLANSRTNSEGVYRFGDLSDGQYAIFTMPSMDSETGSNPLENFATSHMARDGYPSMFFPDARDLASAGKIRVSGGEQARANITLPLEPLQPVMAIVTKPRTAEHDDNISIQVLDAEGHALPYNAQYDASTHTAEAMLPDGTYSLIASMTTRIFRIVGQRNRDSFNLRPMNSEAMSGAVSFAVAGHAVSNLRLPMATTASSPVQVTVSRSPDSPAQAEDPRIIVTLSQTGGWMTDGMVSSYADGPASGALETTNVQPGSYWIHTNTGRGTVCEASFTAGGASLAREPLVLNETGTTPPLMLTLRDDCAKLTISLPASVGLATGMERSYTVYVVPDFDSTEDVVPQTLRASTGGRITLTGFTPGNYHVYVFDRPVALEYHNPAAMAALPGQSVSLSPNAEAELTLEVPQP